MSEGHCCADYVGSDPARRWNASPGFTEPLMPADLPTLPDERQGLFVGDREGCLGLKRDHPEDHGDVVEPSLVVAADVLSHLAEGGEGGADVCDRAERVLPGADIDGGEGPWRPCDRNLNHVPILPLHGFESAGSFAPGLSLRARRCITVRTGRLMRGLPPSSSRVFPSPPITHRIRRKSPDALLRYCILQGHPTRVTDFPYRG